MQGQPFLENLAVSPGRPAEAAGRDAGRAMEGAHEVGEVAEADVVGDVGDRATVVGQQAGGAAQAGADEVLVRRHAEDSAEQPQEVEGAEPGFGGGRIEIDRLMGMVERKFKTV